MLAVNVLSEESAENLTISDLNLTLEKGLMEIGDIPCSSPINPDKYFYVKDFLSEPSMFLSRQRQQSRRRTSLLDLATQFSIATAHGIKIDTNNRYAKSYGVDPINPNLTSRLYNIWGLDRIPKPETQDFLLRSNIYNLLVLGANSNKTEESATTQGQYQGELNYETIYTERQLFWAFHGKTRYELITFFANYLPHFVPDVNNNGMQFSDQTISDLRANYRKLVSGKFKFDELFRQCTPLKATGFRPIAFLPSIFSEINALIALKKLGADANISEGYNDRRGIDILAKWNGVTYEIQVKGRTSLKPSDGIFLLNSYELHLFVKGVLPVGYNPDLFVTHDYNKMVRFLGEIESTNQKRRKEEREVVHPLWVYASSEY